MKKIYVVAMLSVASLGTFSCKKDKDVAPSNQLPTSFSKLSVEQNKSNLESNGVQFINDIKDLSSLPAIDPATNLANLLEKSGFASSGNDPLQVVRALESIHNGHGSETVVYSAMRLHGSVPTDDPTSFQDFFNKYAGTYTWQAANEAWDFTSGGKNLIFKFPSTETGTSNNATLTIKDYQGKQVSVGDYNGDLPANLIMEMMVGTTKVMDYSYKAVYNSAGDPTSLNTSLTMGAYSFGITMGNDTKSATTEYSLKKNGAVMVAFGASSKGNLAIKTIESEEDPSKIVDEGSAYFQVKNIRIAGNINIKGLYADGFTGFAEYDANETKIKKDVELLNKHYKLMVFYADSKEKIADTEYYTFKTKDWVYNFDTYQYEEKEILTYEMRMVFADGSKSDFETYFNKGFDKFNNELEAFMKSF